MSILADPAWHENEQLTAELLEWTGAPADIYLDVRAVAGRLESFVEGADAIVTHTEVNERHGVGVLLRRLFRGRDNILTVRSSENYKGQQNFAGIGLRIRHDDTSREAVFRTVLNAVKGHTITRILCTPYYADDVRNAIALKEIFQVPMCTYLMDDQNICTEGIPDELLRELFAQSSLRLAVSPEMVITYGLKYDCKIWYMPPAVTAANILNEPRAPASAMPDRYTGVIVGNIWGQRWLDMLRDTVRNSGVTLRWHTYDHFRFLNVDRAQLTRDSILLPGKCPLNEQELVEMLRGMPFTVVPTGTLEGSDDRNFIAHLSLPSRMPFMLATSHIPMIVLGSENTPAARFVKQHGIGVVCSYDRKSFREAVEWITAPETNQRLRQNAMAIAGRFSDEGALDWIWQSLEAGKPMDSRYEELMPDPRPNLAHLVETS